MPQNRPFLVEAMSLYLCADVYLHHQHYGVLSIQRAGRAHGYDSLPAEPRVRDGWAGTRRNPADVEATRTEGSWAISREGQDNHRIGAESQLLHYTPDGPPVSGASDRWPVPADSSAISSNRPHYPRLPVRTAGKWRSNRGASG